MIANRLDRIALVFVLFLLALAARAQAKPAALDFSFDPAATVVNWTVNSNVHTVHGTFKLKNGSISIDPVTGVASGLIVIDAASGQSGDNARDSRMNSVVLETAKYPAITFRPTHVEGKVDPTASGSITVDGVMNLHGQDHPMQLAVTLRPKDAAIAAACHFIVPYVAWGLKDPSVMIFRVEKQVAVDINATVTHPTAAASIP
jgi:polyisoprenoid-binding protein YceI